jgi:hypothetical protein
MESDFQKLLDLAVNELGLNILDDHKRAKAILLDYAQGEFRNEINFLLLILEKGYFAKLKQSAEIEIAKNIIVEKLVNENYIQRNIAEEMVCVLANKIKNKDNIETNKADNNENNIKTEEGKIKKNKWICKHCNKENYNTNNICIFCGKYTYHGIEINNTVEMVLPNIQKLNEEKWICRHCEKENSVSDNVCAFCGRYTYH